MDDESSVFGLKREKLAKLWKLAEDAAGTPQPLDAAPDKAELLRDQLAESLPLDAGIAGLLPDILTMVCEKLRPFTGCSFGALLLDPQTDLLLLETIKDLHKKQAQSAPSGPRQEVATAIYYAAIASASVHHQVKITKLSHESLKRSFEELSGSDWLPVDMRQLFTQASEIGVPRTKKEKT
jgi:hypothetical protein